MRAMWVKLARIALRLYLNERLGRIEHDLDEIVRETAADDDLERLSSPVGSKRHRGLEIVALRTLPFAEQFGMQVQRTAARQDFRVRACR